MDIHEMIFDLRLQVIYYETDDEQLGKEYVTNEENQRISLAQAEELLHQREIPFRDLLKVRFETLQLNMSLADFKKYII